MILIGSRALASWFPEIEIPKGTDWDYITYREDEPKPPTDDPVEMHYNKLNDWELVERYGHTQGVLNLEGLAVMYRSHLWRQSPKFQKHIGRYHLYLKPYLMDYDVMLDRQRMTIKELGVSNPNLNQPNDDFFNDPVEKKYNHDWVHELAAHYDKPLYTRMKRDFSLAKCERDMWEGFDYRDKVLTCLEEAYVIATERCMVPNEWNFNRLKAMNVAITKLCTTLTSGWFRDFCIDNWDELWYNVDLNKLDDIKEKINDAERKGNALYQ